MATTSTMNATVAAAAPPPAPTLAQQDDATAAVSLNHQKKRSALEEPSSLTMKSLTVTTNVEKETKDGDDEKKNEEKDDDDDDCDESTTIFDKDFNATSIADHLSSRLEQAFTSSVAQLPMLRQPNVLLQRLRHSYLRNVDIFEVYCSRNLFTLDNLSSSNSKRLRQRVVQLYREIKHSSDIVLPTLQPDDIDGNKTSAAVVQPLVLPEQAANNDGSPPLLASADGDELQALQDEMATLRQRLVTAQQTRVDLRRSLDEIEQAERLADMALEAVAAQTQGQQQLDHRKLHDSMTAVAVGAQGLLLYEQQGRDHLLDNISNNNNNKRNRSELMTSNGDHGENNENNAWNCMLLADKKKPMSVVELYQQEKEQIVVVATARGSNGGATGGGAADDLAKVQQLILGQRQDN